MQKIFENHSLKKFNSFGIESKARYFANCESNLEIKNTLESIAAKKLPVLILGGGSNILFTQEFDGLVIRSAVKGIQKLKEDSKKVYLKVNAGEDWDSFVEYCVLQGYHGVENLSLIPGNVGSCPIQNIGAYGMEVKDSIESVDILEIDGLKEKTLSNADCKFGYRDSIFKTAIKGKVVIVAVNFILLKNSGYVLHYGNVEEELKKYGKLSLSTIRDAIIQIRRRKLPDPAVTGNAGSFFKNPVIPASLAIQIRSKYNNLPHFIQAERKVKVPAAWLIEQCGWKGKRTGEAGVHENQPLVLVNYGNATGREILNLARAVRDSVLEKFGVELEFEVNII